MADTLVQRVTGQATAGAVPVEVAAGAARGDPAGRRGRAGRPGRRRPGPGRGRPRPWSPTRTRRSGCAGSTPDPPTARWSRWTPPGAGSPTGLRRLIQTRDRTCRTPWCGAPIRHTDHVIPVAAGRRRPPRRTGKGCARPATTPNKPPAGPPDPHPDPQGPATGSRSPPPPDTPTPATPHPSHTPDHPATTEASSRNTSAASSTPPDRGARGGCSRPGWEHAELVAGRVCVVPPRQLAPPRVDLAAAALGDAVPRRRRDLHQTQAGRRGAAGSWSPPWGLAQGTARGGDRAATGGGGTGVRSPSASTQPVSQDQNSASRSGSAESSGSAAMGPVST